MKGSPIVATALACLIMLSMYVGMRMILFQDKSGSAQPSSAETTNLISTKQTTAYIEIYFSNQPKSFFISHPASGKVILKVNDIEDTEWSGEILLPVENLPSYEIELKGNVVWTQARDHYEFMQVSISPDQKIASSQTLKAEGNILDIMTFSWKEEL